MKFFSFLLFFTSRLTNVVGHGRLLDPPGRSTLWRFKEYEKFNPPQNYNDNELNCGGYHTQFTINRGRCGPCGDPYNHWIPRENETGGKYGRGIITRWYRTGQMVKIIVQLTTSHKGYFQFRICNRRNINFIENQPCFNKNVLQMSNGSGTKYFVNVERHKSELFNVSVLLPPKLRCDYCVLQWHYRTGNSWGNCVNGTMGMGCGNQEVFRACSDISIS